MNKAYKFRIYPDEEQKILISKTFGCVRFIYNKMLGDKIEYYHQTQKKQNNTPAQYKTEYEWLKEVDSLALANAQMNFLSDEVICVSEKNKKIEIPFKINDFMIADILSRGLYDVFEYLFRDEVVNKKDIEQMINNFRGTLHGEQIFNLNGQEVPRL